MQGSFFSVNRMVSLFLVAYIGFIGPLVYSKPYSPHDIAAPFYTISIFTDSSRQLKLVEFKKRLQQADLSLTSSYHWQAQPTIGTQAAVPTIVNGAQIALRHACTWLDDNAFAISPCPFSKVCDNISLIHSIDLPPPDKPPSL